MKLQPTLWRTCRVLANRTRLKIFSLLLAQPGLTVSALASRFHLTVPAASRHLRALDSRGFLTPRRVSRWVQYRPASADAVEAVQPLEALRAKCQRNPNLDSVFKLATAFTHPRRPEIFRAVQDKPRTLGELKSVTGISPPALLRHLQKLEARGFIVHQRRRRRVYAAIRHSDPFGRVLASLC